ncbi:MAG: type II toxin-antitoxin system VapC family toxin [Methanosarcinales archaeon]
MPIIKDIIDGKLNAVVPSIVFFEMFHKCVYKLHMNMQEMIEFTKQLAFEISYDNIPRLDIESFFKSIENCKNYGLLPIDASIATFMKDNQISTIISQDNDFDRVEGITRLNPV